MALSKQEKRQRVEYLKQLADAYAAGVTPEVLAERVPTLFMRYSFRNVCLILSQKPNAIECAGFHDWRKAGRKVRKGAKGLAILVPMSKKKDDGEDALWFSWRYVFDITDTEEAKEQAA